MNTEISLRELDFDDAPALLALLQAEAQAGRLTFGAEPPSIEQAQAFILRAWLTGGQEYRVVTNEQSAFLGLIGLRAIAPAEQSASIAAPPKPPADFTRAEFCVALLPDSRGRGWARQAARQLLAYAFGPEWPYPPLQRVYMFTAATNAATRRFNAACGFFPAAPEPDAEQQSADCCWYALTRQQYAEGGGISGRC